MSIIAKLAILGDTRYIKNAEALLLSILDEFDFSGREKMQLNIALEEALNTTISSSKGSGELEFVDIAFEKTIESFEISIINRGVPYTFSAEEEYDPGSLNDDEEMLRNHVMRKTVDNVVYRNMGFNGQEIRLIKNLDKLSTFSGAAPEPAETINESIEISIRSIEANEVIEITRCIYDEYKYTYPNEDIYYPERIIRMIHENKLYSTVAVTQTGEIAAHVALKFFPAYPMLLDTCMWVVKRKFRKISVMKTLLPASLKQAEDLDINGVFIEAVMHHPATQKVSKRYGFVSTGFLFLYTPGSTKINYESKGGRRCLGLGFKPNKEILQVGLYIPAPHREHIWRIYDRIGTAVTILESPDKQVIAEKSEITVFQNVGRGVAEIDVNVFGKDFTPVIKSELRRLKTNGIQMILLRVNMERQDCELIYQESIPIGFFYSGIIPHTGNGNFLLLENLMAGVVDYDHLISIEDYAENLNYIRQFDPNEETHLSSVN